MPTHYVNARTAAPIRKVAAGGLAAAVVTLAVWLLSAFAHIDMPDTAAAAATTILSFVVAYLVPSRVGELEAS